MNTSKVKDNYSCFFLFVISSTSFFNLFVIFVIFLISLFNLNNSDIRIIAKIKTKNAISGRASIFNIYSSSFLLFLSCHPSRIGKKSNIMQPTASIPTAHSKLFINHSRVNQSNIEFYKTQVIK